MKYDKEIIQALVNDGYLNANRHKKHPLTVYNYTAHAQFSGMLKAIPMLKTLRGTILDDDFNLVAKGFDKFYNYEELSDEDFPFLDSTNLSVTKKLDGSLIIMFKVGGELVFSTRGSFYSCQAIAAQKLYDDLYGGLDIPDGKTYLFEYIGPDNRIVVSYDNNDLVLLSVVDLYNGVEAGDTRMKVNLPISGKSFNSWDSVYKALKSEDVQNEEGYVLHDLNTNWRCKIKFDDYVRLHRIVTGVSNKSIWEMLSTGQGLSQWIDKVPDEFYKFVKGVEADLTSKFSDMHQKASSIAMTASAFETRKEQAEYILSAGNDVKAAAFNILDGKDPSQTIWKMIRPESFIQPFVNLSES